jgi:hypothetical protein
VMEVLHGRLLYTAQRFLEFAVLMGSTEEREFEVRNNVNNN